MCLLLASCVYQAVSLQTILKINLKKKSDWMRSILVITTINPYPTNVENRVSS